MFQMTRSAVIPQSDRQHADAIRDVLRTSVYRTQSYLEYIVWRAMAGYREPYELAESTMPHDGDKQRLFDVRSDDRLSRYLREGLMPDYPEVVIDSEEHGESFARNYALKVIIDPADGSSGNAEAMQNYGVAALAMRRGEIVASAVSSSKGMCSWTSSAFGGELLVEALVPTIEGNIDDAFPVTLLETARWMKPGMMALGPPNVVAIVAVSEERRALRDELFDFRGARLYTSGGNPMLFPLLCAELGSIVEPKPVKRRDAIFLLAAEILGATITDLDGNALDVAKAFVSDAPLFPPYIVATDAAALEFVLSRKR